VIISINFYQYFINCKYFQSHNELLFYGVSLHLLQQSTNSLILSEWSIFRLCVKAHNAPRVSVNWCLFQKAVHQRRMLHWPVWPSTSPHVTANGLKRICYIKINLLTSFKHVHPTPFLTHGSVILSYSTHFLRNVDLKKALSQIVLLFLWIPSAEYRLCGLVVGVPGYRSRGSGFDSRPLPDFLSSRDSGTGWGQLRSYLNEKVAAPV
jgi:hypothetical protein